MSSNKRKIGYYNLCYNKKENSEIRVEPFFDREDFTSFIEYIKTLTQEEKLKNKSSLKKAIVVEDIDYFNDDDSKIKIIMKSCKYNHSPNYMSSLDGSERESDKRLDEGEKELTHICGQISDDEVYLVVEERKTAIGIGNIIEYFNWLYNKYLILNHLEQDHKIIYGAIPEEDFLDTLDKFARITYADVIMDKEVIGTEGIGLIEESSNLIREEINIIIKSKQKESLPMRAIKGFYESFIAKASRIRRIRVYGKDNNRSNITIDTRFCKKVKYIDVNLDETGVVNSDEMLSKLREMLE